MPLNDPLKKQALDFLKANKIAVVSTISPEGELESAAILYLIDDDFNLRFITRRQTRKFKNLMKKKRVAMVVGAAENTPYSVQIQGEAELLSGNTAGFIEELSRQVDLRNLYYGPFLSVPGIDFAIFKVRIDYLRFLHLNSETLIEEYHQIIP